LDDQVSAAGVGHGSATVEVGAPKDPDAAEGAMGFGTAAFNVTVMVS
jgi:hypothetical protein